MGLVLVGCTEEQIRMACPPDAKFTKESLDKLAAEMRAAKPDATWPDYVVAYRRLRKSCRAIAGAR